MLEEENKDQSEKLIEVVRKGEDLLGKIQAALGDIAQHMIETRLSNEWDEIDEINSIE